MKYTFNITQEIIDSTPRVWKSGGKVYGPILPSLEYFVDECPLEKTINLQNNDWGANIGNDGIMQVWHKDWNTCQYIPITFNRALDFITRWRTNKSVKPFIFEIEL